MTLKDSYMDHISTPQLQLPFDLLPKHSLKCEDWLQNCAAR